jgi:hypothetical protein
VFGEFKKRSPLIGQIDPAAFFPEKFQLTIFFKQFDLGRHRRLGNEKVPGGRGEIEIPGRMVKNAKLIEI